MWQKGMEDTVASKMNTEKTKEEVLARAERGHMGGRRDGT